MRVLLLTAALVHSCTSQRDATTAPFDDLSPLPPLSVGLASASYYRQRGASAFRRNELAASCEAFDEVVALSPRSAATLWQRGISLYYCERQADGMDQFELDVARNPNDTEEMIWHFLCNARARAETVGAARAVAAARAELLHVGPERRPVMRAAGELFRGSGTEAQLLAMATGGTDSNAYFYTHLYLGLWYEAAGDAANARVHIVKAATSGYGSTRSGAVTDSSDYMFHVARVHARRRGWDGTAAPAAAAVITGCGDVAPVDLACGGDTVSSRTPSTCPPACAEVFGAWMGVCGAAADIPELVAFHQLCAATSGSGH
jgi:hypothetical protein